MPAQLSSPQKPLKLTQKTLHLNINIYLCLYMDEKICNTIVEHKSRFVPLIFTERQVALVEKWLVKAPLSKTEQTYLYHTISKKVGVLTIFNEEFHITGDHMIPERIEKAKKILKEINKPAFISGSFLYAHEYNDIDIFVIAKKRTAYTKENRHFTHILEKDLKKPLFFSALKYSVATFSPEFTKPTIQRPDSSELILTYELAIKEIQDRDTEPKTARTLLFDYYLHVKKVILNSFMLMQKYSELKRLSSQEKIIQINTMVKELLLLLYSKKYIYNELVTFLKDIKNLLSEYNHQGNLKIYYELLNEVKNECRRAQA